MALRYHLSDRLAKPIHCFDRDEEKQVSSISPVSKTVKWYISSPTEIRHYGHNHKCVILPLIIHPIEACTGSKWHKKLLIIQNCHNKISKKIDYIMIHPQKRVFVQSPKNNEELIRRNCQDTVCKIPPIPIFYISKTRIQFIATVWGKHC